ncbi:Long chain acyl-CoA synthetase [Vigna angularis]|uniref:Long chain acyl-CoA synthetase n=1 Tax=Phaseolus angularis TaxID=3914 RepID=A0A8T0LJ90_PHAAN|nr:Long chain acyl-CoA synthetase [Vigna angularis]
MAEKTLIVEVEKAKEGTEERPSMGPVYRSVFCNDPTPPPIQGLHTCWDIFRMSVEKYPTKAMLGVREIVDGKPGKYKWQTYQEVYDMVVKVGNSIRACGYGEGVKCGIYGANSPKWIMSMQCSELRDAVYSAAKLAYIFEIFSDTLQHYCRPAMLMDFSVFLYMIPWGHDQTFDLPEKKKSDVCTIMYTSGTTGDPKGVLITNESIITLLAGIDKVLMSCNEKLSEKDVYLSYLPLAHIFDRVIEEAMIMHGASIGFWRGDVKLLLEDIGELKPTIFVAVPRVLDRVYNVFPILNLINRFESENFYRGLHETDSVQFRLLIVKQGLGGRVRIILSGAAPLSKHVEGYLRVVTCAHILQGYGLTETCAGTFVSLPNEKDMLGTVGPPVPYVDVCLESIPEMGYDALGDPPRGEICVRGSTVFKGYYKREDLTKEVMTNGWFHTGDIGEWQPNGAMKIIDRKKNIFKLSQGEYVAVEHLENIYVQASVVDSIWIYGNSFESYLVAIVNPNKQAIEKCAEENHITADFDSVCEDSRTKTYVIGELVKLAKEKKLKGFEFIKAVHLDPVPFDMERGLMTPTFKKKRPELLKYYQNTIDDMYKTLNESNKSNA